MKKNKYFLWHNTLFIKVFLIFWGLFTIFISAAFFIPNLDARSYHQIKPAEIDIYQNELTSYIRNNYLTRLFFVPEQVQKEKNDTLRPVLVNKDGKIFGAKTTEETLLKQFILFSENTPIPLRKQFSDIQIIGPFNVYINYKINKENEEYHLYFINKVNPQKQVINFIFDHPFIILSIIILISIPFLAWLAYSLTAPIRRLQVLTRKVANGNFVIDESLEKKGVVEFKELAYNFNQMSQSLDNLLKVRQHLLSAISHELRTPLTRLQLANGLLRRRIGDRPELERIDMETERLDKMIGDLLHLSRNQYRNNLVRRCFVIEQIWQDILQDAIFEAENLSIKLNVQYHIPTGKHYIYGNLENLSSALENIIRNGFKYTKDQLDIMISLHNNELFITVDDNGEGLPENEFEKIFTPFYRVDEIRTRTVEGTGLGLAIVASTIQLHKGKVWAQKSVLGGLSIHLTLPLDPDCINQMD
ncbi:MAG: envelope stress sensor histidine kinase CpxA [Pasteurellaceae bacterium]|nr:envelope stress sensor histidine kinase CpxA [Pasteurellaceae bacterium]